MEKKNTRKHFRLRKTIPKVNNAPNSSIRREKIKDYASILQSGATIIALIFAAIWFIYQDRAVEKIDTSHKLECRKINDQLLWIGAKIKLENKGNVTAFLTKGKVRVQKILPLASHIKKRIESDQSLIPNKELVVDWPVIGPTIIDGFKSEIRSGETDEFDVDFIVPSYVKSIKLYSYFDRVTDSTLGWKHSSFHDLCNARRLN